MKSLKEHILNALILLLNGLKSNIVDNVVSTSVSSPLSANQGKILNDNINNLKKDIESNNILWSGNSIGYIELGDIPSDEEEKASTILLSQNISDQKNGIVLVFSTNSADQCFSSFYISKNFVKDQVNHNMHFLALGNYYNFVAKYINIQNKSLILHDRSQIYTNSNISTTSNYALRYVIGV